MLSRSIIRFNRLNCSRSVFSSKNQISYLRCYSTSSSIISRRTGLTDEQLQLLDMAEDFSDRELAPHADMWDREGIFPIDKLKQLAGLGLAGMFVREEHGGTGLTRLEGNIIFEALSSGCVGTTAYLTIHNMCTWMIDQFGTDGQRSKWLPELLSMNRLASYCLTEPGSGSDAASLTTRAVKDGDHYVLNGAKAFISGGSVTDDYLVMCRTGDNHDGPSGISCIKVAKGTPGLSFGKLERKMGWNCQPTTAVIFEDCRVPLDCVIGGEEGLGQGFKMAMKGLDGGRLSIASCSLGAAHACMKHSLDHTSTRKQFKKRIIDNQAIQFRIANMAEELVIARTMVRQAASLLDDKHPNAREHCALAKKIATDKGFSICNDALQLHGGYGYLKDYPIERYVRDVRVHQILEGTNEIMQLIVSRSIVDGTSTTR